MRIHRERRAVPLLALIAAFALGVLAHTAPACAQADTNITETAQPDLVKMLPARTAESKTLVVGVALGSPPDDFRNDKGELAGWEIDLLKASSQALGLKLDLQATTFDALIPGLQAKRFDAATGQMGVTEVREKVIDQIGWLLGNELFAALADNPIKVNSLDDLCGVTIATTRGSREAEFARLHQPECQKLGKKPIELLVFNDGASAADAMLSKRAELFWVGSTAVSYFVAQSHGKTKVVGHYTDLAYIGVGLAKGSDMAKPLQAAVQHIMDDGTYTKIVKKWGLEDGAVKTAPLNPTGIVR
jgi:polar amino acid transport system substrate-binding protein